MQKSWHMHLRTDHLTPRRIRLNQGSLDNICQSCATFVCHHSNSRRRKIYEAQASLRSFQMKRKTRPGRFGLEPEYAPRYGLSRGDGSSTSACAHLPQPLRIFKEPFEPIQELGCLNMQRHSRVRPVGLFHVGKLNGPYRMPL